MRHLVTIRMPGKPIGKGRPRFLKRGFKTAAGHTQYTYTPAETRAYEAALTLIARRQMRGRAPFEGALAVLIYAHFAYPVSLPKNRRAIARATGRPDWENVGKIACDALNKVVWNDDAQIVEGTVVKLFSSEPRLEIFVSEAP